MLGKMISLLFVVTMVLIGCAGSDGNTTPSPIGSWMYLNTNGVDAAGFELSSDNTFVAMRIKLTSRKSANTQVHAGTYSISGNQLTTTTNASTCPNESKETETVAFQQDDNNSLAIMDDSGMVEFQRNNSNGNEVDQAAFIFGCFGSDGRFTPSPIHSL